MSRRLTFLAKSSYFNTPGIKGWLMARLFRGLGQVPIDRSGGPASGMALSAGEQVLLRGGVLGIYPEGTRSPDGRLYRGRTGVARVALATGAPVIPVAMIGTERIQPPGTVLPRMAPLSIRIGEPLNFSRHEGLHDDPAVLRSVTDEIMRAVQKLSGQEYVDSYSPGPVKRGAVAQAR